MELLRNFACHISSIRAKKFNDRVANLKFSEITEKNIVIFAPHPDDETFACGGLIAKKASEGAFFNASSAFCR